MDRKAVIKSIALVVIIFFIIAIFLIIKPIKAFSIGNNLVNLSYQSTTFQGRSYTPRCSDCHLPISFKYSGSLAPSSITINSSLLKNYYLLLSNDSSCVKDLWIEFYTNITDQADNISELCFPFQIDNETIDNCTIINNPYNETRQDFQRIGSSLITLYKNQEHIIDIRGILFPKLNQSCSIDIFPSLKISGLELNFSKLATWNSSVDFKRQINFTYINRSFHNREYSIPCLVNGSWGVSDGTVTNYIWGRCDATNVSFLYYNNMSDFYFVNGSEGTQLAMDTEGKNSAYDFNPNTTWDNFSVVLLPREAENYNIGGINSSGHISATANFSTACGFPSKPRVTQKINVSTGYWRNAISHYDHATLCPVVRVSAPVSITSWTNIFFLNSQAFSADKRFMTWRITTSARVFAFTASGDFQFTGFSCTNTDANLSLNSWYMLAFVYDSDANLSIFVGNQNGSNYWLSSCTISTLELNSATDKQLYLGGYPEAGSDNNFLGNFSFFQINQTRSRPWVEAFYNITMLNKSNLGAEVSNAPANNNPTNNISAITPTTAYTNSSLNCSGAVNDTDADKSNVSIRWFNNSAGTGTANVSITRLNLASGTPVSHTLGDVVSRGETWNCTINATDAQAGAGNPVSTTRAISNTAPTIDSSVVWNETSPNINKAQINSSANFSDVDGDTLTIRYTFHKNNNSISGNSSVTISYITNKSYAVDDVLTVMVWATESSLNTTLVNSSNLTISAAAGNTAPNITNMTIANGTAILAYTNSTLNCSGNYSDIEGDKGNVTIAWYNQTGTNDSLQERTTILNVLNGGPVSDTLGSSIQAKLETWNCTINATDAQANAGIQNSTRVRGIANTPADTPTVNMSYFEDGLAIANNSISIKNLISGARRVCVLGANDVDGDNVAQHLYLNTTSYPTVLTENYSCFGFCQQYESQFVTDDGTLYYVRCRADDSDDSVDLSPYSPQSYFQENGKPISVFPFLPPNGTTIIDSTPTLEWNETNDTESANQTITYHIQISNVPTFATLRYNLTSSSNSTDSGVLEDTYWYWRVRGHDGVEYGAFSAYGEFIVQSVLPEDKKGGSSAGGAAGKDRDINYEDLITNLSLWKLRPDKIDSYFLYLPDNDTQKAELTITSNIGLIDCSVDVPRDKANSSCAIDTTSLDKTKLKVIMIIPRPKNVLLSEFPITVAIKNKFGFIEEVSGKIRIINLGVYLPVTETRIKENNILENPYLFRIDRGILIGITYILIIILIILIAIFIRFVPK